MNDVLIQYENKDFSIWAVEKSKNVLFSLCWLIETSPAIATNEYLQDAVCNALKVYTMLKGQLNCFDYNDATQIVIKYGNDGFSFLNDLMDSSRESTLMKGVFRNEVNEAIMELIQPTKRTNRTAIATILARIDEPNSWLKKIGNDLERVHNGEKTWEWFCSLHAADNVDFDLVFEDKLVRTVYEQFFSDAQ